MFIQKDDSPLNSNDNRHWLVTLVPHLALCLGRLQSVAKQNDVSVVNKDSRSSLLPFSAARIFSLFAIVCAPFLGGAGKVHAQAVLVTIAEDPGQQSSTVEGVDVFDFDSLPVGRHSNVVWEGVGQFDELLVAEGYLGFGALDPSDGWNSRFNWNGWGGYSGTEPIVSATTITLNEKSAYFGLYWSAGDGDDILQFYDGDTLIAEFSTETVVDSASLSNDYYGDPNHNNQYNASLPYNHIEPYAFINFYGDANTSWDRIVLTQTYDAGSGFETDNISSRVAPLISSTDDISLIGNVIAEVSGTSTTVVSNDTTTWDFSASSSEASDTQTTATQSAQITSTLSDTVGSSYVVSGSGSSSNTTNWVEGEVGRFAIEIDGVTRYLTVSAEDLGGLDP